MKGATAATVPTLRHQQVKPYLVPTSVSDGSMMDWQSYERSVTSMEVSDMSQYNEAQESLMDVSDYTDTTGNSSCKFTLIVL